MIQIQNYQMTNCLIGKPLKKSKNSNLMKLKNLLILLMTKNCILVMISSMVIRSFQNRILTIDQGYIIGPGDEVLVLLWGETELNEKFIVSRDGYIFISNIGQVFVNGLTLENSKKIIFFIKSIL